MKRFETTLPDRKQRFWFALFAALLMIAAQVADIGHEHEAEAELAHGDEVTCEICLLALTGDDADIASVTPSAAPSGSEVANKPPLFGLPVEKCDTRARSPPFLLI